jgi:hydroxymethylpyrimidine/phosphomethylpyrimidine kinase
MRKLDIALTIAGSDSGGGAGIQADLKTFAALGVHGTSAITCLTAQNPKGVLGVLPVEADFVKLQLEAIFAELPPRAIKTGMLFSAEIIVEVRAFLEGLRKMPPLVIDPVMVATSGAKLLRDDAVMAMTELFPMAKVITPNLDEAAALLGRELKEPEDLRVAARELQSIYGCAVLAKGGHLRGMSEAIDFFYDGKEELMLSAPFVRGVATHGTGCTYSAAIAAGLAGGFTLRASVLAAKAHISRAIGESARIGKHQVLGPAFISVEV